MTILAIDTATQVCSAALLKGGTVMAERSEIAPQRHSELLLPFIDELLRARGMRPEEIDGIAVSIGPGSFTGLRIGLSVAKGIAAGTGARIVPIPTPAVFARRIGADMHCPVSVVIPARRGEFYTARYLAGVEPQALSEIETHYRAEFVDVLRSFPDDVIAGDGIELLLKEVADEGVKRRLLDSIGKSFHVSSAIYTGMLAPYFPEVDAVDAVPLYIKQFESGSSIAPVR